MKIGAITIALGLASAAWACSPSAPPRPAPRTTTPVANQHLQPPGPLSPTAINGAQFTEALAGAGSGAATQAGPAPNPMLIRAEVLLDRAGVSPGVIDGEAGSNERKAVAVFQQERGLPATGRIDANTWRALLRDKAPVVQRYVITAADIAGPFAPNVGEDFVKLAALPQGPLYSGPHEELGERFHMTQGLVQALNPALDFGKAGTTLVVAAPGAPTLAKGQVARIVVSKSKDQVSAFGGDGQLLAVYPATVGSTERPSPHGLHKVKGVAYNPPYVYDPSKLHWGPRSHGKLTIKPGPKGPVGVVWIDLNAPSYGIHGSPDPSLIGKTASHGCVRLTNWDALALAHGVKPGVPVAFVG